jgi:EAL domain-containing protein (putative c-di-GMP-specific phosphodiesterase class I)
MGMAKPTPVATDWRGVLARACAGEGVHALFQPLVDLQRGVIVGYEALVRFGRADSPGPERWFAAARVHGCEAALQAAALATALAARPDLPADTFLSVNVSPTVLGAEPVAGRLDAEDDLRGLVLELDEHTPVDSYAELGRHLDRFRSRGALLAIDDAGSGYAGLAHMLELRPSILKLDRTLVADIDADEAKRILVEMLGVYAGHLDAWVLAEGIETLAELETLRSLGVPLGQGWVLGRPATPWAPIAGPAHHAMRQAGPAPVERGCRVGILLERVETADAARRDEAVAALAAGPPDAFVVLVDEHRRPVTAVTPARARTGSWGPVLAVALSTPLTDVAQRALTRPAELRFEPVVCTDPAGCALGMVRIERIMELLARAVGRRV